MHSEPLAQAVKSLAQNIPYYYCIPVLNFKSTVLKMCHLKFKMPSELFLLIRYEKDLFCNSLVITRTRTRTRTTFILIDRDARGENTPLVLMFPAEGVLKGVWERGRGDDGGKGVSGGLQTTYMCCRPPEDSHSNENIRHTV